MDTWACLGRFKCRFSAGIFFFFCVCLLSLGGASELTNSRATITAASVLRRDDLWGPLIAQANAPADISICMDERTFIFPFADTDDHTPIIITMVVYASLCKCFCQAGRMWALCWSRKAMRREWGPLAYRCSSLRSPSRTAQRFSFFFFPSKLENSI